MSIKTLKSGQELVLGVARGQGGQPGRFQRLGRGSEQTPGGDDRSFIDFTCADITAWLHDHTGDS